MDRPVYRQRVRYEIEKWMPDRDAKAEGRDHNAVWPDPRLGAKEREGKRAETYEVIFRTSKGETATWKAPNEQAWRSFEEGRAYKGKVRSNGEVAEVEGELDDPDLDQVFKPLQVLGISRIERQIVGQRRGCNQEIHRAGTRLPALELNCIRYDTKSSRHGGIDRKRLKLASMAPRRLSRRCRARSSLAIRTP